MSESQIFVATPLGKNGMLHIGTASFCASVNAYPNVQWGFTMTHSPEMSRNVIIERHLKENKDTTHFLFLDSDVSPPPNMLQRMLAHDADFVTALTPLYFDDRVVWNVAIPDIDKWFMISNKMPEEPFHTSKCGGGALLVKREVIEAIKWPYFHTEYQEMDESNKAIKCGEDVWFCKRAIECGYKILCDPTLMCHHYNQVDLLEIYNSIAAQIGDSLNQKHAIESHLPVLRHAVKHTDGVIIEFGCGDGSTPALNKLGNQYNKEIISYENNPDWYKKFTHLNGCQKISLVDDYLTAEVPDRIGVAFIDCRPCSMRGKIISRLKDKTDVFVLHDSESSLYGYENIYSDFKYRFDYTEVVPHTTVLSNTNNLESFKEI